MSQDQSGKRSSLLATRTRLGLVLAIGLGLTLAAGLFALIGRAAPGDPVLQGGLQPPSWAKTRLCTAKTRVANPL